MGDVAVIIMDCETTGLPQPALVPLDQQPHIIEFGAIKVHDGTLEEIKQIHFLCNPGVPLQPIITKITGLTDKDLSKAKKFAAYVKPLTEFFIGETALVAHNLAFDLRMLELELLRLDRVLHFPWPMDHICTVERTTHLTGKYLKLTELYQILFDKDPEQKHRAIGDVEILHEICRQLRERDIL